jgi:Uma2 family endonuclease
MRRYEAMPELEHAELIEGVVYIMTSPVRHRDHGEPHSRFMTWVGVYSSYTPGTQTGDNSTTELDDDNVPQPDGLLRIEEDCGGRSRIDERGYLEGSPELIGEISATTASYDLHDKLNAFRRNRVLEYVVWRVVDREIDWFCWQDGSYERMAPEAGGVYKSRVFPGLWLDAAALLSGDMPQVLQVLQQGLASAEHAEFVARLAAAKAARR